MRSFCEAFMAKFNDEKSEILLIETKEYRDEVVRTRKTNKTTSSRIDQFIRIVKIKESLRTLEAYISNNNKTSVQLENILEIQAKILESWSRINLLTKGKELVLKALLQSRVIYLAIANKMPKDIAQRMTCQMKFFIQEGKRSLMNQTDATEPKNNRGLNLPDIETRLEVTQVMWLKKYLVPITERPLWAFVTDQVIFKYTQKSPVVNDWNKINQILQTWDITDTKEKKVPIYIKDVIVVNKDQRRKILL